MTGWDERAFVDWIADGPSRAPDGGLDRALAATRGIRQRPAVIASTTSPTPAAAGRTIPIRAVMLLAIVALLAAALLTTLVAGTRHSPRPAPFTGVAGNGRIAFSEGGVISFTGPDGQSIQQISGGDPLNHDPVFSPDGTKLAYWGVAEKKGPVRLWVADADGGHARSVTGSTRFGTSPFASPSWSPDGTRLAFSAPDGKVDRLYVVAADGSSPPRAITGLDASRGGPTWSPDGQWIAFDRIGGPGVPEESVSIIHPDGTGETRLYHHTASGDGPAIAGPAWAPDSTALVYVRPADPYDEADLDEHSRVAVWTLGGVETIVYTAHQSWWLSAPSWSPDRTWISFTSGGELPSRSVHIIHPDGTGERVILNGSIPDGPFACGETWAPDATALIAVCGPWMLVPINGGDPHPLHVPAGTNVIDWQRVAP